MEPIIENKNVLEILEEKLELFRSKKERLEKNLQNKCEKTIEIQSELTHLQNQLEINEREIEENKKEIEKINEFLSEIENGYNSLVESGNCLMEIVKNADK